MKVCVSCQKDVEGKPARKIREDRIIRGIRAIKRALRVAQNNELYVCTDCMPSHTERRKSFEKSMLFASVFAGLILIVLIGAFILSGRFDAWAFVSAFVVAGFILALPIFKYTPAVEGGAPPPVPMPPVPPPVPMEPKEAKTEAKEEKKKKSKKKGE